MRIKTDTEGGARKEGGQSNERAALRHAFPVGESEEICLAESLEKTPVDAAPPHEDGPMDEPISGATAVPGSGRLHRPFAKRVAASLNSESSLIGVESMTADQITLRIEKKKRGWKAGGGEGA